MSDHSPNFSIEEIRKLANSPTGQQLLQMLKQTDEAKLQKIVQQMNNGNLEGAKSSVSRLLSSQDQEFLRKFGG